MGTVDEDRKAFYASVDWAEIHRESQEREALRQAARETAETCGKCGEAIGPMTHNFEIYRVREYERFIPMCVKCAPEWMVSRRGTPMRIIPGQEVYEWKCAGCGREVVFSMSESQYRRRIYCSEECKRTWKSKGSKRARTNPVKKTCEACGTQFEAKRSDAKTCSPKCRQRAYRQRLQV